MKQNKFKQNKFASKFKAFTNKDHKFVENGKYFLIAPILILVVGIILLATIGFNLGIDFTGGSIVKVQFGTGLTSSQYTASKATIEKVLKKNKITKFSLQKEGDSKETNISIKFQDVKGANEAKMQEILASVKESLLNDLNKNNEYSNLKIEENSRIGATASNSLILNAVLAVVIATILMLIYIAIRFEFASGLSAIIALLHDVIIMTSLVLIFRIQVNSSFIAALITIIGYSINNTIVLFDRIRENLRKEHLQNATNAQVVNLSIKETFIRNLNTALTTIISVALLAIIGVPSIREFIIPILFGLFAGTYSSFFIAGTVWAKIYNRKKDKRLANRINKEKNKDLNKKSNKEVEDKIMI